MASELIIDGIRKVFGKDDKAVEVLKRIDIHVQPGEFLILVGPSGCGKSTLLNIIAGLEEATEGDLRIGERSVIHVSPAQRDIAMVFQSYALYPTMTVAQNISFALEMRKIPKEEREKRVAKVAAMLQIEHLLQRRPAQLSGGQRQRVAMGRALARQPALFLFDEPLSNLDAKLRVEMRAEIKRMHQMSGVTSVYVTHDQVEAMTLGTRIAVMKDGVLQQLGSPQDVYMRPANTYVAGFIGSPTMNLIDGKRDHSTSTFTADTLHIDSAPEQAATVGLRPEHLVLSSSAAWKGTVSMVENTGADTYITLETTAGNVTLRGDPMQATQIGDTVGIAIDANQLHWFDADGLRIS